MIIAHICSLPPFSAGSARCLLSGVIRKSTRLLVYLVFLNTCMLVAYTSPADAQAKSASQQPQVEYGLASWYGDPFHGRRTASGEIYDMSQLTAAHKYATFGSHAIVTNLDTGRSVRVRINDRGPFVEGRILDVSRAAAMRLGILKVGVANVKVSFLSRAQSAVTFIVQAGSYRDQNNAARVQRGLETHYPSTQTVKAAHGSQVLYRVRLGPFSTEDKARQVASQVKALGYTSAVLSRP